MPKTSASAQVVPKGEGVSMRLLGDRYTVLVTGEQTAGRYCWIEGAIGPGNGPPPHYHTREDESFFVLEGQLTFTLGERKVTVGPGDALHVPVGAVHSFCNQTETVARMLIQTTPAGFDRMVLDCGDPIAIDDAPRPPTKKEVGNFLPRAGDYGVQLIDSY